MDRDANAAINILSCGFEQLGVGHAEGTSPEIGDFWCANEARSDSSTPVETALTVDTPVSAKRVVETGSPTLKERTVQAVREFGGVVHRFVRLIENTVSEIKISEFANSVCNESLKPVWGTSSIGQTKSHHVGWAIGHPEVDVETRILAAVPDNDIWAAAAAERALYADQTSVSLFCELIETAEEIGFVLDRLAHFEGDLNWSLFPRYWDIEDEFDRDFTATFEPETERRLREAITARGYDSRLPEDWDFEDLELRWG